MKTPAPGGEHGGNLYEAARRTGHRVEDLVDFSANVNPLGLPRRVRRILCSAIPHVAHYPDPESDELAHTLASRWGIPREAILLGNGSTELIHLIPRALPVRRALIVGPTFSEYGRAVTLAGGDMRWVLAREKTGFAPPLDDLLRHLQTNDDQSSGTRIDTVFLCNPNSPTGQVLAPQQLESLVQSCMKHRIWLVIDEAFVEYCEDLSVISWTRSYPRLLILRSFTKFFGLPGLRLGCLVGDVEAVEAVRSFQPPWSVNLLAQIAGRELLREHRFLIRSATLMRRAREQLTRGLERIPGVRIFPSAANFLLLAIEGKSQARATLKTLEGQGILVKSCERYPGMQPNLIRVAVKLPADNRRFITSLARALACRDLYS